MGGLEQGKSNKAAVTSSKLSSQNLSKGERAGASHEIKRERESL